MVEWSAVGHDGFLPRRREEFVTERRANRSWWIYSYALHKICYRNGDIVIWFYIEVSIHVLPRSMNDVVAHGPWSLGPVSFALTPTPTPMNSLTHVKSHNHVITASGLITRASPEIFVITSPIFTSGSQVGIWQHSTIQKLECLASFCTNDGFMKPRRLCFSDRYIC